MDHLGAAVGPLIASALVALGVGLRTTFVVARRSSASWRPSCSSCACATAAPRSERPDDAAAVAVGALRPGFFSYLGVCVLFALGNSSDAFLLVRAREVGWSAAVLPLLWLFHHLVKSAAALPGGALSDRHSRAVVVAAGWAAYALTYVGFGFATAPLAGRWSCSSPTRSTTASPRAPSAPSSPISPSAAAAGAPSASTTASSAWRRCRPAS